MRLPDRWHILRDQSLSLEGGELTNLFVLGDASLVATGYEDSLVTKRY